MHIFRKILYRTLILGLLLAPAASGFMLPPSTAKAQPLLFQLAAEDPEQTVAVIVQQSAPMADLESKVARLGGQVTKDLHLINAFAAELPASSALELASEPGVRWVSLDGQLAGAGKPAPKDNSPQLPENTYLDTMKVRAVWDLGYRGEGIGVAVIDSGISTDRDFSTEIGKPFTRIVKAVSFNASSFQTSDATGHGTHVAGIIAGNGDASDGFYSGVAPKVDLISLKISDEIGMAYESDAVAAMQWVYDNKDAYNIRVVNLSIQSAAEVSYHNSPMDAAAEILWFNGVVVVAASGNWDPQGDYNPIRAAPANDPFIITVGASTEKGSARIQDDAWANFSAWGATQDGFYKPDLLAPGKDIISVLATNSNWDVEYPDKVVLPDEYIRLSGSSMAAPMVTGAVALLLQAEPNLTPDQVKYRLINASASLQGVAYLDVYKAITTPTTESANTNLTASQLLWSGSEPINWSSVSWNSVSWNSVSWNSVSWNAVNWNAVNWNSVYWGE